MISVSSVRYNSLVNTFLAALNCRTYLFILCWLKLVSEASPTGTLSGLNPSGYDVFTQPWVRLEIAAHCHGSGTIVGADWLHSECDADFLHCQYVLINSVERRQGRKKAIMKTNDEAAWIGFYFPARATFVIKMQSHAESSTALRLLLNGKMSGNVKCVLCWDLIDCFHLFVCLCLCYTRRWPDLFQRCMKNWQRAECPGFLFRTIPLYLFLNLWDNKMYNSTQLQVSSHSRMEISNVNLATFVLMLQDSTREKD